MTTHLSTAQLGIALNVTARRLQWWDAQGFLCPARGKLTQYGGANQRAYSRTDVILAAVIKKLKASGSVIAPYASSLRSLKRRIAVNPTAPFILISPRHKRFYFAFARTPGEAIQIAVALPGAWLIDIADVRRAAESIQEKTR